YCSNEYPDLTESGVVLSLDQNGYDFMEDRVLAWNNTARFREPFNVQWDFLGIYTSGQYVRYGNEIYRCSAVTCIGTPSVSAEWVQENIMTVEFRGLIANQDEFRYQGNANGPTIVRTDSTYTRGGKTLPYYAFGTNV